MVVFLGGGADSYNLLVPHSSCAGRDLYAQYAEIRTNVALPKNDLLQINVPAGTQPCDKFGMHPSLKFTKGLYDQGDAAWIANIGAMVEPVTKAEYKAETRRLPPDLFAHNVQVRVMHNLHPQYANAKGVLGRANEALRHAKTSTPLASQLFSGVGNVKMLEGSLPPTVVHHTEGIKRYADRDALAGPLANLTGMQSGSMFAETYSTSFEDTLRITETVGEMLSTTSLDTESKFDKVWETAKEHASRNRAPLHLKQVAKLLKIRAQLGMERAAFVTSHGAYDTHTNLGEVLNWNMGDFDSSLEVFYEELKLQGLWDNVTIITVSDFARTLTSNGLGTDHAWGGNHLVIGGAVRGGKIFGHYPTNLAEDGADSLNVGRGRLIPTTPWDAMWHGIAQWYGVEGEHMSTVLPNAANFPPEQLITGEQLFKMA